MDDASLLGLSFQCRCEPKERIWRKEKTAAPVVENRIFSTMKTLLILIVVAGLASTVAAQPVETAKDVAKTTAAH